MPGYAAAGVVEAWLVSLPEQLVSIYTEPVPVERRWGEVRALEAGDTATYVATGMSVVLADVFLNY